MKMQIWHHKSMARDKPFTHRKLRFGVENREAFYVARTQTAARNVPLAISLRLSRGDQNGSAPIAGSEQQQGWFLILRLEGICLLGCRLFGFMIEFSCGDYVT